MSVLPWLCRIVQCPSLKGGPRHGVKILAALARDSWILSFCKQGPDLLFQKSLDDQPEIVLTLYIEICLSIVVASFCGPWIFLRGEACHGDNEI